MNSDPIRLRSAQGIVDFYAAFSASDFDTMARMLHADCRLEFPGSRFDNVVLGREPIIALFQGVQQAFGGSLRFHPKWAMHQPDAAAGDLVAVHWYTTGRLPQGPYLNRGVAWYRLEDGLVRDFLDFFDTEIVSAFFGADATPASAAALVERLRGLAPEAALEHLSQLA